MASIYYKDLVKAASGNNANLKKINTFGTKNDDMKYLERARDLAMNAAADRQSAALREFKAAEKTIRQNAADNRKKAYAAARISAIGNAEREAASGVGGNLYAAPRSGYSETSRIAEDAALGENLTAVNVAEAQELNEIASKVAAARMTGAANLNELEADFAKKFSDLYTKTKRYAAEDAKDERDYLYAVNKAENDRRQKASLANQEMAWKYFQQFGDASMLVACGVIDAEDKARMENYFKSVQTAKKR